MRIQRVFLYSSYIDPDENFFLTSGTFLIFCYTNEFILIIWSDKRIHVYFLSVIFLIFLNVLTTSSKIIRFQPNPERHSLNFQVLQSWYHAS